ncbi:MAG: hypothetical protein HY293_22635, partial [Planctomycetes bacterium]|nr:hypothetical protein [Planctomycetota bacterium]
PARVDDVAFYHHVRSRLEHEDSLIVSRLSWLMAAESFLFTAYAIVLNGTPSPAHRRLVLLIPVVAIVSSALIFVGIVAAVRAMSWIREQLRARVPDEASVGLPPVRTPDSIMRPGLAAPLLLPLLFVAVWLYLLATGAY